MNDYAITSLNMPVCFEHSRLSENGITDNGIEISLGVFMKKENIKIGNIPAILYGNNSEKLFIFVHGSESKKEEAKRFANIANKKDLQVLSFDLPKHGERKNEDYMCITDMLKFKDGDFFVSDWLRNRNTLEYIGIWEQIYNPDFNYGEFGIIKSQAGLNSFKNLTKLQFSKCEF